MPLSRFATRTAHRLAALALLALLGACASRIPAPTPMPPADLRDGPGAKPPPGLELLPDAEPRVETILPGGANKPYEVQGESYVPRTDDARVRELGIASWYGRKFHGRPTASGERYDMYAMTAAHRTMPIPSYARVRNPANGREIVVRVNDRGPFHSDRVIDLSYAAALRLDLLRGAAPVEVERLTNEEIRSGGWRKGRPAAAATAAVAPAATAATGASATDSSAGPGWWLQLGAFRERAGAERMNEWAARDADWLAPLLAVFDAPSGYRVQAGPFASRAEAQAAAERLARALHLKPLVLQRR